MKRYGLNILISIDQFANTVLGGDPDETISSRAAKGQHRWYWRALGHVLEWLDPGHLKDSLEHDEGEDAILKQKKK